MSGKRRAKAGLWIAVVLVLFSLLSLAQVVQPEWIDYGCNLVWETNGCACNGLSCCCQQGAKYEHKGWSFGGELELPLTVTVSCECTAVFIFLSGCTDSDSESGEGEVVARAMCYFSSGAYGCDDTIFNSSCY